MNLKLCYWLYMSGHKSDAKPYRTYFSTYTMEIILEYIHNMVLTDSDTMASIVQVIDLSLRSRGIN